MYTHVHTHTHTHTHTQFYMELNVPEKNKAEVLGVAREELTEKVRLPKLRQRR